MATRLIAKYTKTSKYKNTNTIVDGFNFHSKAESRRYLDLCMLRDMGEVLYFIRQVPFHLPGNVKYVCDFMVFWKSGKVTVEDVKGFVTQSFKRSKKMVEALYPVEIELIKA